MIMTNYRSMYRSALGLALFATFPACNIPVDNSTAGATQGGSSSSSSTGNPSGLPTGIPTTPDTMSTPGTSDSTASTNGAPSSTGQGPGGAGSSTSAPGSSSSSNNTSSGSDSSGSSTDSSASDSSSSGGSSADDPYIWLEDIESADSMDWVKAQNKKTTPLLEAVPGFGQTRDDLLAIGDSKDRIPDIRRIGDKVYNFWQDADHVRGIWRRTTLESYRAETTEWETVLDLDKLEKDTGEKWVWGGATCLAPEGRRCMISLSPGGSDAAVIREFDTGANNFVIGGFELPEAKSQVSWEDENHILVATNFGPDSLTDSGYARTIRRWKRGSNLESATEVFAGQKSDVAVWSSHTESQGIKRTVLGRRISFYESEIFRLSADNKLAKYPVPPSANVGFWGPWILIELKEDWVIKDKTHKQGSLLIADEVSFLSGSPEFQLLYSPDPKRSLISFTATKDYLLLAESEDVKGRLNEWHFEKNGGGWTKRSVSLPGNGGVEVSAYDKRTSNNYFLKYEDNLTPVTLFLGSGGKDERESLRTSPTFFDATELQVEQHFATSKDGTKIPYFQISRKDINLDAKNPTILHGYGGFEVSLKPSYRAEVGKAWLEKGGVYVVANIRGGGEYGPAWHRAALKENRQRAFDDFAAVGEDLIARKVTAAAHLGIEGGSNGGLLTGVSMVQRPDLWNAVVSSVPLLDMKRYHRLSAGPSWMAEYGDPDKEEEWEYLSKYSPYQNVKPDVDYPALFLNTSTKDDRVHPAHARKMLAKMLAQGHKNLFYYESTEGGHGGAANHKQSAYRSAMIYAFFAKELGLKLQ